MNGYPEEISILFRSYEQVSFKVEINAQELEIDWGNGEVFTYQVQGCLVVEREFNVAGEYLVRIKGKQIVSLNVSRLNLIALSLLCPKLNYLDCSVNELSELDLSCCPRLEELYCNSNNIARLLLLKQAYLLQMDVSYNSLESLDITGCTSLQALYCAANRLSEIRLNAGVPLIYLDLGNNLLEAEALNAIFRQLPRRLGIKKIHYMQNPGTDSCDTSLLGIKVYR